MEGWKKRMGEKNGLEMVPGICGGGRDEIGVQYVEGVFIAERNLLEDEGSASERQRHDWAGLIFHFFSGGCAMNLREKLLLGVGFISLRIHIIHEH
jgi:hypothetical protein